MKLKRAWNSSQNVHSETATNNRIDNSTRHRVATSVLPQRRASQRRGNSHSSRTSGTLK